MLPPSSSLAVLAPKQRRCSPTPLSPIFFGRSPTMPSPIRKVPQGNNLWEEIGGQACHSLTRVSTRELRENQVRRPLNSSAQPRAPAARVDAERPHPRIQPSGRPEAPQEVRSGQASSTEPAGSGEEAAASSRWKMLASQSKMAARGPDCALACLSSPACHPDTEGRAHSSTWAIIWPREGGGGGVGAAASSRWQMLASQSKMAARAPGRALACLSSPACHPDTESWAHSSTWAIIWPREGGGGGVAAAAISRYVANTRLTTRSKMAAHDTAFNGISDTAFHDRAQ